MSHQTFIPLIDINSTCDKSTSGESISHANSPSAPSRTLELQVKNSRETCVVMKKQIIFDRYIILFSEEENIVNTLSDDHENEKTSCLVSIDEDSIQSIDLDTVCEESLCEEQLSEWMENRGEGIWGANIVNDEHIVKIDDYPNI